MEIKDFSKLVYTKTIENQGYSVNLDGNVPVSGYMVSYPAREFRVNVFAFGPEHIKEYLNKNIGKLVHRGNYLGTWIDHDVVYIDVSINILDLDLALKIARQWRQQSIYSFWNNRTIFLDL